MLGLFIELVHDYIYLNTFGCRVAPVPPPPAPATGRLESYRTPGSPPTLALAPSIIHSQPTNTHTLKLLTLSFPPSSGVSSPP